MIGLFETVLRLSISGGLTCIIIIGLVTLLRVRLPKAWLYCLWLVAVLRFVIPVSFSLPLNIPQIIIVPEYASAETADGSSPVASDTYELTPYQDAASQAIKQNQATLSQFEPIAVKIDTAILLSAVWLAGAGSMLLWHITAYNLTIRKLKRDRVLLKTDTIPVYECVLISTPILAGLLHPAVYLPKDFSAAPLAIKHELCHLNRGDIWCKWLIQLVVCLHWFNPLVYLLKREMSRLSELACDETVVRALDDAERCAYGHMLLETLRLSSGFGGPMIATLGKDKRWLKERMLGIMENKKTTRKAAVTMSGLVVIVLCGALFFGAILFGCSPSIEVPTVSAASNSAAAPDNVTASPSASASVYTNPDVSAASPSGSVIKIICFITNIIVDLPFDNDPAVIGTWQPVGNVDSASSFVPEKSSSSSVTDTWALVIDKDYAHGMYAYYTQHAGYQTQNYPQWASAVSFEIKELDGRTFLFLEEKSSGGHTSYIVFEKLSDTSPVHTFRADMPGNVVIIETSL